MKLQSEISTKPKLQLKYNQRSRCKDFWVLHELSFAQKRSDLFAQCANSSQTIRLFCTDLWLAQHAQHAHSMRTTCEEVPDNIKKHDARFWTFLKRHLLFHGLASETVKQVAGRRFRSSTTVLLYVKKRRFLGCSVKHHSIHGWDIQTVKLFHSILQHIMDSQATVCGWSWKQIKALGSRQKTILTNNSTGIFSDLFTVHGGVEMP